MNTFIIVSRLKKIIALKLSTDTHILKTTRCSPNFQRYNFSETFVTETRVIIIHEMVIASYNIHIGLNGLTGVSKNLAK